MATLSFRSTTEKQALLVQPISFFAYILSKELFLSTNSKFIYNKNKEIAQFWSLKERHVQQWVNKLEKKPISDLCEAWENTNELEKSFNMNRTFKNKDRPQSFLERILKISKWKYTQMSRSRFENDWYFV